MLVQPALVSRMFFGNFWKTMEPLHQRLVKCKSVFAVVSLLGDEIPALGRNLTDFNWGG